MPVASYFDAPNCGASLSGVHPGIFRPPASPSLSSSTYLGRSTGSLWSDISTPGPNSKRKRRRARDSTTPLNDWAMTGDSCSTGYTYGTADHRFDSGSRRRPDERRYILAGQIETPSGPAHRNPPDMDDSVYSDVDYRRALGPKRPCAEQTSPQFTFATTHRPQSDTQTPQSSASWSFFPINAISGVVGKVWEFCKAGAFRGFYAGGGKGYDMQGVPTTAAAAAAAPPPPTTGQVWCNEHDVPTLPGYDGPSPAGSDYPTYAYERDTPDSTPPPPAKRRHIYDGPHPGDELRRNWVMVSEPTTKRRQSIVSSRSSVTGRAPQRSKLVASHSGRRLSKPTSRLSTASSFSLHSSHSSPYGASPANREPASFASPRSPPQARHSPSRLPVPARPQSSGDFSSSMHHLQQPSRIPSPTPYRRQRAGSTASSVAGVSPSLGASVSSTKARQRDHITYQNQEAAMQDRSTISTTPRLDAEAQTLAARRMQDEMATDLRINSFNARLRDMIRQGREALGTTIEVDGFEDGDGDGGVMEIWEDE
ncbi:hypothetical protein F5X96DRAFT_678296 [Biscogniauxia mediterranea]|nr:hypothetical protein F5X96DRAFT_678296 [Biscogniauxia mediterranea]